MKSGTPRRFQVIPARAKISVARIFAIAAFVFVLAVWALAQSEGPGSTGEWSELSTSTVTELIVAILVTMLLNSLSVAAETSADLLRPAHVKHLRDKDERQGAKLQRVLDQEVTYVAACKLSSDLARLLIFLFVLGLSPGVVRLLGWPLNFTNTLLAALLLMIPVAIVNLIFEMVPRSYASLHPHAVAERLFWFMRLAAIVFSIPAGLVTTLANLITARFGGRASLASVNLAEEEIKTIAESAEETGEIETGEKEMLHSVFEFTDTVAREVMTPRVDIDALPLSSSTDAVADLIRTSGHSRIPLFEQTDDQIVGIVHAKDLFLAMLDGKAAAVRDLMRPAIFVPENKNLHELLAEMRGSRSQMVIVQDEFGGTAGIVTIEDIVEELVGDIVDEYDVEEPEIIPAEDGWMADGKTHIDDLNDEIGSEFSSEEFDTVGGFVFGLFGRQPKPNEQISVDGFRFIVATTDGRRIQKLKIERLPENPGTPREEVHS